jgi:hypothetical protein
VAAVLAAWIIWSRLARKRSRRAALNHATLSGPPDTSPRGRLVALSQSTREALANQFGPGWRAKTNEELAAEPQLRESLGDERLEELIGFLVQIDHLKFAPNRTNHQQESLEEQLSTWEPRLADLGKRLKTRPDRRPKNGSPRRHPASSPPSASSSPKVRASGK